MAYIRWHGIYAIKDQHVIDKLEFEKDKNVLVDWFLRLRNREYPEFVRKYAQYNETMKFQEDEALLHAALLEYGKRRIIEDTLKEEGILQAIATMVDLDVYKNYLTEHLLEWYGAYSLITEEISIDKLINSILEEKNLIIDISDTEKQILMRYAQFLRDVNTFKMELEKFINTAMTDIAPNLKAIAGPIIGATLITQAGSLKRLATLSSSTIQLLGAEKALFRHLKKGAKPPKYGILFKHTLVHKAPPHKRGKIARMLSGKIAIAAKLDYYGNYSMIQELKDVIKKKMNIIMKK